VNDLVVHSELAALITDDEDADAATTIVEGVGQTVEQLALVKNGKTLLNITSLGHGDDATIITNVQDTVLLEDRTDHVLNNHGWRWVADK
jgi:hypothetical protein